ncbi:hypothetical protein RCC89_04980 [Cytophagaceae bacterium ABcell3]|nr:hypothetical protein RCC89_04980 [Cytophagaceae bacterium ABcell3]
MKVSFEDLSPESIVWIYQAERVLNNEEQKTVMARMDDFFSSWQSHNEDVEAAGKIFYDRFVVIGAESGEHVSGCGIDKSIHFIKELEKELNIKLMDRSFVIYGTEKEFSQTTLQEIKKLVSEEKVSSDIKIFNNTITKKKELENKWQIPLKESWLSKYIPIKNNNSHK